MIIREKKFVVFSIFILALLATGIEDLQADKQTPKQNNKLTTNQDKALPSPFRLLPDVEVKVAGFERVSTELGMSGIEFPHDKLRLKYILKNSGLAPCPEGGSYQIQVKRNGESVVNSGYTNLLGNPGTTYNYSFIDTIVHGQAKELNYKITVTTNFKEATAGNNSRDSMLNEPMIHGSGNVDYAITEFTSSFVDGPAGRTFYFVVTVKNNSLFYSSTEASAYIYIKRNDEPNHHRQFSYRPLRHQIARPYRACHIYHRPQGVGDFLPGTIGSRLFWILWMILIPTSATTPRPKKFSSKTCAEPDSRHSQLKRME